MKEIAIDTNILVYAYDTTDHKKHKIAKELIAKCWKKEIKYILSVQTLAEFFIVITKKVQNPLSEEQAKQIIKDITKFSSWKIINYSERTVVKAIEIHKKIKKHFWDALLSATIMEEGIERIYTENIKDFTLEGLQPINPFN